MHAGVAESQNGWSCGDIWRPHGPQPAQAGSARVACPRPHPVISKDGESTASLGKLLASDHLHSKTVKTVFLCLYGISCIWKCAYWFLSCLSTPTLPSPIPSLFQVLIGIGKTNIHTSLSLLQDEQLQPLLLCQKPQTLIYMAIHWIHFIPGSISVSY